MSFERIEDLATDFSAEAVAFLLIPLVADFVDLVPSSPAGLEVDCSKLDSAFLFMIWKIVNILRGTVRM